LKPRLGAPSARPALKGGTQLRPSGRVAAGAERVFQRAIIRGRPRNHPWPHRAIIRGQTARSSAADCAIVRGRVSVALEVETRPGGLTRGGARWMLVVVNGNQQGCHEQ
jgi:hypothetical protein